MSKGAAVAALALALALVSASCAGTGADPSSPAPAAPEPVAAASVPEPAAVDVSGQASVEEPPPSADAGSGAEAAVEPQPASIASEQWGDCLLETFPSQTPLPDGSIHVAGLPDGFAYNSVPASQGPHDEADWTVFGAHHEPQDEMLTVHSLEHGGISISYGSEVESGPVAQIEQWWMQAPDGLIILPDPRLGSRIAAATWVADADLPADDVYRTSVGMVLTCPVLDLAALERFRTSYLGHGPERIPVEFMAPGN